MSSVRSGASARLFDPNVDSGDNIQRNTGEATRAQNAPNALTLTTRRERKQSEVLTVRQHPEYVTWGLRLPGMLRKAGS
jgi:hypothetical protein